MKIEVVMNQDNLFEMADSVRSKESFLEFLAALECSWYDRIEEWENGDIPAFLSACRTWAAAKSGLTGKPMVDEEPAWSGFANILHAGKFYE